MDIKIDISNSMTNRSDIEKLTAKAEQGLDEIWSGRNHEDNWVKIPVNHDKDILDDIDKSGLLIGGKCGLVVIVGDQKLINITRAMVVALPEDGGFPQCMFVEETASPRTIEKNLLRCRQNEIVLIAISEEKQSRTLLSNYKILEHFMEEKYGTEKAKERIYFVTGAASTPFREIIEQKKYSTITNTNIYREPVAVLSPTVLLPLSICGHDITRFVEGSEDMVSDTEWDFNGTRMAICQSLACSKGRKIKQIVFDEELYYLSKLICDDTYIMPRDYGKFANSESEKKDFIVLFTVKESDMDVIVPESQYYEDTSLRLLLEREKKELKDYMDKEHIPYVEITLEKLDEYSLGQLSYFLMISKAITRYLK